THPRAPSNDSQSARIEPSRASLPTLDNQHLSTRVVAGRLAARGADQCRDAGARRCRRAHDRLPGGVHGGSTSTHSAGDEDADPLVDLNTQEEQELPFLTLGTLGATDKVAVLVCETRVQVSRLEGMMASAADACKGVRKFLDQVVREKGHKMVTEGAIEKGASMAMDIDV
ncbi:hypothetical protein CHU98_g2836, partial [Xylaria longipes]